MAALTPRHLDALTSRGVLGRFAERSWVEEFYLAGSAALALYTGHRLVRDLDLMSNVNRLTPPERRDLLADLLELEPAAEVETARDGYLFARVNGVGLRLFYYPYPLVEPLAEVEGVAVASAADLGLMKLAAIISRGTRRDFVDLFLLCRLLPLAELLDRAEDKFGHVRDFPLQALKGLADLSLVAGEPMPSLAEPLAWDEVESWARAEVRSLGRARVGLPVG
ncbi:MAG TPA: nucleotidyl transferase AbiEii/AbiGii toxin family protein [Thermoanaerobaculia bacterium]|nr:nucleotidyl transferase AbiEii/AbiGii toxin family protein [Thermoanaerobaculia bacterium]